MASLIDVVKTSGCQCLDGIAHQKPAKDTLPDGNDVGSARVPDETILRIGSATSVGSREVFAVAGSAWNPNSRCGGMSAEDAAKEYIKRGFSHESARKEVMSQFPDSFRLPVAAAGAGPMVPSSESNVMAEIQRKLAQLERENQQLQQENQVLEKAADGDAISDTVSEEGSEPEEDISRKRSEQKVSSNTEVLMSSAKYWKPAWQVLTYLVAAAGVFFVLIAPTFEWGQPAHRRLQAFDDWEMPPRGLGGADTDVQLSSSAGHGSAGHGSHSGSGSGSGGGGHQLIINFAYCTVSAGMFALLVHVLDQPLILGYILGGVFIGPVGLTLIDSALDVGTISEFGLILLLFMIGLELDVSELLKMGKTVLVTGGLQFPICLSIHLVIFWGLSSIGVSFGEGSYSVVYMAACCGISSTLVVVRQLSQKMETDTAAGRLTIGILICQDLWLMFMMAIQPNLVDPEFLGFMKAFGMLAVLLLIAFVYSKYVLPAVFSIASTSMELLLVLALAWAFFICCIAILPWFKEPMELAALIAGVAMATYPYSIELNSKIKYIRDYFIALYFVALGMQVPSPTLDDIMKALLSCAIVLAVRWVGIFLVVRLLENDDRLAVVSTMNLSEVSEFGLVLCSLGKSYDHVGADTFTILIWTFAILAVAASYFIRYNHGVYVLVHRCLLRLRGVHSELGDDSEHFEFRDGRLWVPSTSTEDRDIVLLGFGKIASSLIAEIQERCPAVLPRLHVIDPSPQFEQKLRSKGVSFACGAIGEKASLVHSMPENVKAIKLFLITQPDARLGRYTNKGLMDLARDLDCHRKGLTKVICSSENNIDAKSLYNAGADYVLMLVKLSAERLADMLVQYTGGTGGDLEGVLKAQAQTDKTNERRVSQVMNPEQRTKKSYRGA